MRKFRSGKRSKVVREARIGQAGTCLIGVLLVHHDIDDERQSTCRVCAHARDPREARARACLWGDPSHGSRPPQPSDVRPTGPTSLSSRPGRASGRCTALLWPEPWPVCLYCHTPYSATRLRPIGTPPGGVSSPREETMAAACHAPDRLRLPTIPAPDPAGASMPPLSVPTLAPTYPSCLVEAHEMIDVRSGVDHTFDCVCTACSKTPANSLLLHPDARRGYIGCEVGFHRVRALPGAEPAGEEATKQAA
jgi:hypothetical protein